MSNKKRRVHNEERITMCAIIGVSVMIFMLTCWNLPKLNQICVLNDEFGYWGTAAYFAGYDWTGLSGTSPYYGFGVAPFYMVLFKLFHDASFMYKAAIVLNAGMLTASFILSLKICKKIFPNITEFYRILFCMFLTLYPNNLVQSQIAWSETLLYLWFWVCCYMVVSIYEKPILYKAALYGAWLLYGIMIHQRTLGVVCAGILTALVLKLAKKISWKFLLVFAGAAAFTFLVFYVVKGYLDANFWNAINGSIASKNNFSGQIERVGNIFSVQGLVNFFYEVCGQAFYLIVSTCLLVFCFLSACGKKIVRVLQTLVKKRKLICDKEGFVFLFVFMAFAATFLISTISTAGLTNRGDVLLYGRYNEFLVGPVLLIGLECLYKSRERWRGFAFATGVSVCVAYVVNHVFANHKFTAFYCTNCVGVATSFSNSAYYSAGTYSALVKCLVAVFITLLFIAGYKAKMCNEHFLPGDKRSARGMCVLSGICIFTMLWVPAVNYNNDNTYQLQQTFSENVIDIVDFVKDGEIKESLYYVADDWSQSAFQRDISDRGVKYLQFYLYDKKIEIEGIRKLSAKNRYCLVRKESWCYRNMFGKYDLIYENDEYGVFESKL